MPVSQQPQPIAEFRPSIAATPYKHFTERKGIIMELDQICQGAKAASRTLATLGTNEKNQALIAVADALIAASADIIAANEKDLENGRNNHMPEGLLDPRRIDNRSRFAG